MKPPLWNTVGARSKDQPGSQDAPVHTPPSGSHTERKRGFWKSLDWKLMLALIFPVMLETLDYTVVATAQSRIASVFNALPLESYIGTSYLLASTVFLPFFASIADIYGRHFGLQLSLLFFLFGSALSTGAMNINMVLAGRGIAGVGAAGLLTIVRTVVSDTMSLDQNNFQQSMVFFLYAIGYSIGPLIGGLLVEANFRWVFAINLPCTTLSMLLCFLFLRNRYRERGAVDNELQAETPALTPRRNPASIVNTWLPKLTLIDWVGTFLFVSGGILVLLALNWGPNDRWKTARVIVNLVLGAILITTFVMWEIILQRRLPNATGESGYIRTKYTGVFRARPMIPIELFTCYDMCVVQFDAFIAGTVMFVMFYFVAIFATVVTGLPPAEAGIQLLYFAPGLGIGTILSIRLVKSLRQPRYPIRLGTVIMTVGIGLIQMAMQNDKQGQVNGFMAMVGVGLGLMQAPLVIHARFIKPNHVAITSAMILFFIAFGGTVGLAQCFTILNARVNAYISAQLTSLGGTLSVSDLAALESLFASGGLASVTSLGGLPSAVQSVVRGAFRDGVRWGFVSLVPWLGVGSILSMFLKRIEVSDSDKKGTEGGDGVEHVEMVPRTGEEIERVEVLAR